MADSETLTLAPTGREILRVSADGSSVLRLNEGLWVCLDDAKLYQDVHRQRPLLDERGEHIVDEGYAKSIGLL